MEVKQFIFILLAFLALPSRAAMICTMATATYTCSAADLNGVSHGPCTCPPPVPKSDPVCPRIEGIKMPCLQRLEVTSCSYQYQVCVPEPTPTPTPPPQCQHPRYCTSTGQRCVQYAQATCTHTSTHQGACIVYNEAGTCLQYEIITTTEEYACDGACIKYEDYTSTIVCGCDD